MTIDEVMTNLSIQLAIKRRLGQSRQADAIALGIEALQVYKKSKAAGWFPPGYKLPGETEE